MVEQNPLFVSFLTFYENWGQEVNLTGFLIRKLSGLLKECCA